MARKALVVSVIAAATVALLLAAVALRQGSATAQPIAGATYTDTVSGGGTVEERGEVLIAEVVGGNGRVHG